MPEFDIGGTRRAILRSNLRGPQKLVLVAPLDFWSRKRPRPWPSIPRLAADTSLGERTVQKALGELEAAGVVVVSRRKNKSSRYDLSGIRLACLLRPLDLHREWAEKQLAAISDGIPGGIQADSGNPRHETSQAVTPPQMAEVVQELHQGGAGGASQNPLGVHQVPPKSPILSEVPKGSAATLSATGVAANDPPSAAVAQKGSRKEKKKPEAKSPRDGSTIELEAFYGDHYMTAKHVRWSGASKPDPRARRAFKDLIAKVDGLEAAKGVVAVAFADEWTVQHRILPWEILTDCDKHRGIESVKADEIEFKLRASTEPELRSQLTVRDDHRHYVDFARANRLAHPDGGTIRRAWLFHHGFNPENCNWLNEDDWSQTEWALWRAAQGVVTPRFKALVSHSDRKRLCRLTFAQGWTPVDHPRAVLWSTSKQSLAEAKLWFAEWEAEQKAKSA
jgi:hypothetical protein